MDLAAKDPTTSLAISASGEVVRRGKWTEMRTGGGDGAEQVEQAIAEFADRSPRVGDAGLASTRLRIGAAATARWGFVTRPLAIAARSKIYDVVFQHPEKSEIAISVPLPLDVGVGASGSKKSLTWRVVLGLAEGSSCEGLVAGGVAVRVSVGVGELTPLGELGVGPSGVRLSDERTARHKATVDALHTAATRALIEAGAAGITLVVEVGAPAPGGTCVPYAAVFEVLSTLRAAGVPTVRFLGAAASPAPAARPPAPPGVFPTPIPPALPRASDPVAPPAPPSAAAAVLDEKRIRGLDFQDVSIASVATYLRTVSELQFYVTPKATALDVKVKLKLLADVTVRQALDFVTLPYGLKWELRDGIVVISAHDEGPREGK
jgi:hypothetical protein